MMSERRADPFGILALAAAGTMVAHEVGYLANGDGPDEAHAYFGLLGPAVFVAITVAGWIAAVRIVRRDPGRPPSLALLAGMQVGLYLAMEFAEQISSAATPAAVSPPVLLGLAMQPLTAWVALQLLRAGRRVIEALFVEVRPTSPTRPAFIPTPVAVLVGTPSLFHLHVRGPPVR